MDQTKLVYSQFYPGQVLTSESLNNAFDYLEEQIRLTRANALGFGILKGLEVETTSSYVDICPGSAITPKGEMIFIPQKVRFTSAVKIDDNPEYSYILFENEKKAKEYGKGTVVAIPSLLTYQVALLPHIAEIQRLKCSGTSCDLNLKEQVYELLPVLIRTTSVSKAYVKTPSFNFKPVSLDELSGLDTAVNINVLREKVMNLFFANKERLFNVLKSIDSDFAYNVNELLQFVPKSKISRPGITINDSWFFLYDSFADYKTEASLLTDTLLKMQALGMDGNNREQVIPFYYLQYLEDLARATNALLSFSQYFAKKYPRVRKADIPEVDYVVLSKSCRSIWINLFSSDYDWERSVLRNMIHRINAMSAAFLSGRNPDTFTLRLIRQGSRGSLAQRPVPFYYKDPESLRDVLNVGAPFFNIPPDNDYYPGQNDEVSLQGHYGKPVSAVREKLEEFIYKYDFNLNAIFVKLEKKKLNSKYVDYLNNNFLTSSTFNKIHTFLYGKRHIISQWAEQETTSSGKRVILEVDELVSKEIDRLVLKAYDKLSRGTAGIVNKEEVDKLISKEVDKLISKATDLMSRTSISKMGIADVGILIREAVDKQISARVETLALLEVDRQVSSEVDMLVSAAVDKLASTTAGTLIKEDVEKYISADVDKLISKSVEKYANTTVAKMGLVDADKLIRSAVDKQIRVRIDKLTYPTLEKLAVRKTSIPNKSKPSLSEMKTYDDYLGHRWEIPDFNTRPWIPDDFDFSKPLPPDDILEPMKPFIPTEDPDPGFVRFPGRPGVGVGSDEEADPEESEPKEDRKESAKIAARAFYSVYLSLGLNGLKSFVEKAGGVKEVDRKTSMIMAYAFKGVTFDDIANMYFYLFDGSSNMTVAQLKKDINVSTIAAMCSYAVKTYNEECRFALQTRGYKRGSTCCIFYFNEKVIGDACIG